MLPYPLPPGKLPMFWVGRKKPRDGYGDSYFLGVVIFRQLYQPRGFWARRKYDNFTPPLRPRQPYPVKNSMAIEQDEIEKIAELARIRIAPDQIGPLTRRITEILGMVDQLQAADTRDVEPMANPMDAVQRLRADEVTEENRREAYQAIAPAVENGLYLVPRVVE